MANIDEDFSTIVLKDEDDNEVEFQLIMKFDIEDKEYVIVAPTEEEDPEAFAFRIDKDENGEPLFVTIEDNEEFNMVLESYEAFSSEEDVLN